MAQHHEDDIPEFSTPTLKENAFIHFLGPQGQPDKEKLGKFRKKIQQRYDELWKISYFLELAEGEAGEEARENALKEAKVMASAIMLQDLSSLEKIGEVWDMEGDHGRRMELRRQVVRLCRRILQLDETFNDNEELGMFKQIIPDIKVILFEKHLIPRDPLKNVPSSNLVDPKVGKAYLAQEELQLRVKNGEDISLLDPPNSAFWTKPKNVAGVDPVKDLNEGIVFKPEEEFNFKNVITAGHNPKIRVSKEIQVGPHKFKNWKFKFDDEVNVEVAATRIMKLVGYPADLILYVRRPKVYFSKENGASWEKFQQDFLQFYPGKARLRRLVAEHGHDEKGEYVIFHEVSARPSLSHEERVGPFHWNRLGHSERREVRGHVLLQAFIGNTDIKDAHNNKTKLVKRPNSSPYLPLESDSWDIVSQVSDVGNGFGQIFFKNNPNKFSHILIEPQYHAGRSPASMIKLNYRRYHVVHRPHPFRKINYADMKWMARYLAQMTPAQLKSILREANWPGPLQELYMEKLSHRRNDIVAAFELEKEGFTLWQTRVPWPSKELWGFRVDGYVGNNGKLLRNFRDKDNYYPTNFRARPLDYYHPYRGPNPLLKGPKDLPGLVDGTLKLIARRSFKQGRSGKKRRVSRVYEYQRSDRSSVVMVQIRTLSIETTALQLQQRIDKINTMMADPEFIPFTHTLYNDKRYGRIETEANFFLNQKAVNCLLKGQDCKGNWAAFREKHFPSRASITLDQWASWVVSKWDERDVLRIKESAGLVGEDHVRKFVHVQGEFLPPDEEIKRIWIGREF